MFMSLVLLAYFLSFTDLPPEILGSEPPVSFTFEQFHKNGTLDSAIALYGDAVVEGSAVKMTRTGKILYRKPVKFLWGNNGLSTNFSFSISAYGSNNLAFFLKSPSWRLFRLSKDVLVVKFANNANSSRIGIRLDRKLLGGSCSLHGANLAISSGEKLHSWVDYDVVSKRIEVRLSKSRALRPASPFISCPVDISHVSLQEALLVGIRSSGDYYNSTEKNSTQGSCIYNWSFVVKHGAPYLLHSEPLDPRLYLVSSQDGSRVHPTSYRWANVMAWMYGLVCGVLVAFIVMFVRNVISRRSPVSAVEYPLPPVHVLYEKTCMVGENCSRNAPT